MLYPDVNLQKRTQQNTTRYRTALYLRLSREDGDKTESDSIANQRTLLEAYAIDHPELCIVDEFVDDGYSGSNFERPAFQNLFRELEQGTINCILVKDYCAIIGLNQKDLENQGILAWSLLFLTENKGLSQ